MSDLNNVHWLHLLKWPNDSSNGLMCRWCWMSANMRARETTIMQLIVNPRLHCAPTTMWTCKCGKRTNVSLTHSAQDISLTNIRKTQYPLYTACVYNTFVIEIEPTLRRMYGTCSKMYQHAHKCDAGKSFTIRFFFHSFALKHNGNVHVRTGPYVMLFGVAKVLPRVFKWLSFHISIHIVLTFCIPGRWGTLKRALSMTIKSRRAHTRKRMQLERVVG